VKCARKHIWSRNPTIGVGIPTDKIRNSVSWKLVILISVRNTELEFQGKDLRLKIASSNLDIKKLYFLNKRRKCKMHHLPENRPSLCALYSVHLVSVVTVPSASLLLKFHENLE